MTDPDDPRTELAELIAGVSAHLDWYASTGCIGLPRASDAPKWMQSQTPDASCVQDAYPMHSAPDLASSRPVGRMVEARAPGAPAAPLELRPPEPPAPVPLVAKTSKPEPRLEPAERARRLQVLNETVKGCTKCGLHERRTQTVFARGTGSSGLCFVGEGPGADEDAQGFPFVGKAGQLLDRMIEAMGFTRDEVYVANIVKCRPPENRKPEPNEMATCRPYLVEQLDILQPEVIVALGATAVDGLLGVSGGITRLRGKWKLYGGKVAVMPTFHPAYLLRTPSAKREVWEDLQAVVRQMGRALPSR
jgi:uracil-DNA glycosylase family 4